MGDFKSVAARFVDDVDVDIAAVSGLEPLSSLTSSAKFFGFIFIRAGADPKSGSSGSDFAFPGKGSEIEIMKIGWLNI